MTFYDGSDSAVSPGADSDILACITGGVTQPYYRALPASIEDSALTAPCSIDCFNCQLFEEKAQSLERLELNRRVPQMAEILCKGCRDQKPDERYYVPSEIVMTS